MKVYIKSLNPYAPLIPYGIDNYEYIDTIQEAFEAIDKWKKVIGNNPNIVCIVCMADYEAKDFLGKEKLEEYKYIGELSYLELMFTLNKIPLCECATFDDNQFISNDYFAKRLNVKKDDFVVNTLTGEIWRAVRDIESNSIAELSFNSDANTAIEGNNEFNRCTPFYFLRHAYPEELTDEYLTSHGWK